MSNLTLRPIALVFGYMGAWTSLAYAGQLLASPSFAGVAGVQAGFSLAFLLVFGLRYAPLLIAGPPIAAAMGWLPAAAPPPVLAGIAAAVAYGGATYLLRRAGFRAPLRASRDVLLLFAGALGGSGLAAASGGLGAVLIAAAAPAAHLQAGLALWATELVGCILFAPLFLLLLRPLRPRPARRLPVSRRRRHSRRWALWLAEAVATALLFTGSVLLWGGATVTPYLLLLLPITALALAHGAEAAAVAAAGLGIAAALLGPSLDAPFPPADLAVLLAALAAVGLLVGSASTERRRASRRIAQRDAELLRLREAERHWCDVARNIDTAQSLARIGSWRWQAGSDAMWWSEAMFRLFGSERGACAPTLTAFLTFVVAEDRAAVAAVFQADGEGNVGSGAAPARASPLYYRIRRADGEERVLQTAYRVERHASGRMEAVAGASQDITEQDAAHRAWRRSEELLRAVTGNLPGVVYQRRMQPDGRLSITYLSEAARDVYGLEPDLLERNPALLAALVHPEDRERWKAALSQSARDLTPLQLDLRIVPRPGEVRWIRSISKARRLPDGDVAWDGINLDVTHEKEAETAFRLSEDRFRTLATAAPMGIARLRCDDHRIVYANPSWERMFGYCNGQMVGVSGPQLCADPEQWRAMAARLAGEGEVRHEELCMRRADGSSVWVQFSFHLLEEGRREEFVVAGMDITRLKEAEAELARKGHDLAERVKELRCLYAAAQLTSSGAPLDEVCAQLAAAIPSGFQNPEHTCARITIHDKEFLSPNWQQCRSRRGAPIMLADSQVGFLEVGLAPAEQEANGAFLPEEARMLDGIALSIGQMLAQREMTSKLQQSQKLEIIGQLTGGIAHDFNNLLTVILGNAELASEEVQDASTVSASLSLIERAARRGSELTRQLLAFARREALEPRTASPAELFGDFGPLIQRTVGEFIDLKMNIAADLPPIFTDPTQLETALLNLTLNARDSMPNGGELVIETAIAHLDPEYASQHGDLEPGDYVRVSVTDTGSGIAAEHLERIFDPFFTTKGVGKGSGLGLSMVYGFIKQTGGHIKVYSQVGVGTTVDLYLPVADRTTRMETAPDAEAAEPVGRGERILVVEDEVDVMSLVSRSLAGAGYRVLQAGDGAQALTLLRGGERPDLLLSDVGLPGHLSGVDLAAAALQLHPGLSILFISGHDHEALLARGMTEDSVSILTKPFRKAQLLGQVARLLALRREAAALA